MKLFKGDSNKSSIISLIVTILFWVLAFVLMWDWTFNGGGNIQSDNVLSLNLEISQGDEGNEDHTSQASKPVSQNTEIENQDNTEEPDTPIEQPEEVPVEIPEEPKNDPIPEPEPFPEPAKPIKETPKETPTPVETPKEPPKPIKLAKSVDDNLGDLWSYDFESVSESIDDLFDDDNSKKSGNLNAVENNDSTAQAAASGNGTSGLELRLKNLENRKLVSPEEPVIHLSNRSSSLITQSLKVHLAFTITQRGNVTEIKFNPANVLPSSIREEIQKVLQDWVYEQGLTQTVTFEIQIVK